MENLVDNTGKINKGEVMRRALANVESLSEKEILDAIKSLVKILPKETKYLFLNSRDINYNQMFIIDGCTKKEIANHLLGYLKDSSFVTTNENAGPMNIEHHNMIDIKDFSLNKDSQRLDLYIDGIYFKLEQASWQVEVIKDMLDKEGK